MKRLTIIIDGKVVRTFHFLVHRLNWKALMDFIKECNREKA